MNHPSTFILPLAAGRVLDVLHTFLTVGERGIISHAEIAKYGNIGESTVSAAMPILVEHGFLTRTWDDEINGGRGGYLLTLLPLPPIEDAARHTHPSVIGSTTDAASASEWDHSVIGAPPNMVLDHDLSQEEESARACDPIELEQDPFYQHLIRIPNMNPKTARQVVQDQFGTLTDFCHEEALAAKRPGIETPPYYVIFEWQHHRHVLPYIEAARSTAPPPRRSRSRHASVDDDGIVGRPVTEADLDAAAALEARVLALAPPGADDEDIGVLITVLSSGATDVEALAQMEADRAMRSARPSSDEVYDALREHTRQRTRR